MISTEMRQKLILALDYSYVQEAIGMVHKVRPVVTHYKVGLELFSSSGGDLFHFFNDEELDFFVDLKFHDIPNTVSRAVRRIMPHAPTMMTVHALGGEKMLQKAVEGKNGHENAEKTKLLAVTILTHHDDGELPSIGIEDKISDQVKRLAELAQRSGVDGVVCSAHEAPVLRSLCGEDFTLVCPGIRPSGVAADDQSRIMTPGQAMQAGADYLVVGRPIRNAEDPQGVANQILNEMAK